MSEWILRHADALRGGSFLGVLVLFIALEALAPRRMRTRRIAPRWLGHGALMAIGVVCVRLIAPAGALGAALHAESTGAGLLPLVGAPDGLAWAAALVALDLAIYLQHRAFHRVPLLWKLHALHHRDLDLDATSGVRFHPGEIVVSLGWKVAVVWSLGGPPGAVVVYEALLACASVAVHSNLRVPARLERGLRAPFITPDLHRVHHSVHLDESNSNFGTITPLWDRLFGTFRAEPRGGQVAMRLGVDSETAG